VEPKVWRSVFEQYIKAEGFLAYGWCWRAGEGEVAVLAEKTEKDGVSTVSVAFLLAATIVGLLLIPFLVLQSNLLLFQISVRQNLVGVLYSVICLLGVAAVFYPNKCRGIFQRTQNPVYQVGIPSSPIRIRGHHPDCQNFASNRIRLGQREFCAACSGLLIGAIIAWVSNVLQFFVGFSVVWASMGLLMLGEVGLVLGVTQIKFAGVAKAIVNVVFVVGSFVTLAEADVLGGSMLVDVYVLGLIVFLLWLRILLSERNNRRTCQTCQSCFQ
jgi:hypothetical protein